MNRIVSLNDDSAEWRRMGRAIRYLSEHYLDQPRLEEAAAAAGLSPFHFQRMFTRYVGVSPKAFIGHLTLVHAKGALCEGSSVLDAALDAGLSGPSRLHDLCVKIEAMTPGDYAKAGRGVAIDYGFAPCAFGSALVLTTDKGVCGLAFGNEGEEDAMLADMKARWPNADYRSNNSRAEKYCAPDLRSRKGRRTCTPSDGHAMADQGMASASGDFRRRSCQLWRHCAKAGMPKCQPGGGRRDWAQSGILDHSLPPGSGKQWRAYRLSLGHRAQAGNVGRGSGENGSEAEHIRHGVEPRRLALSPQRGA